MSHLRPCSRSVWNLFLLLICLILVGLFLSHIVGTQSVGALPAAQATPTCPPTGLPKLVPTVTNLDAMICDLLSTMPLPMPWEVMGLPTI